LGERALGDPHEPGIEWRAYIELAVTCLPHCTSHLLPILGGEVRVRLDVMPPVPIAFGPPLESGPHPLLLVLDADLLFPLAVGSSRLLQLTGEVPPHWVVGLGFEGGEAIEVYAERRIRYFSPWPIALPVPYPQHWVSGEGQRFKQALVAEVLPFIEAATQARRAAFNLVGASLAGLFVTHVMRNAPGLFRGYGIVSPRLGDQDRRMIREFDGLSPGWLPPDACIVVCVGDGEDVPGTDLQDMAANAAELAQVLASLHGGARGRAQHHVLSGESHASVPAAALARCIRTLMARGEQPK
jgi:predicted alpha/beta superfamily hydrolase